MVHVSNKPMTAHIIAVEVRTKQEQKVAISKKADRDQTVLPSKIRCCQFISLLRRSPRSLVYGKRRCDEPEERLRLGLLDVRIVPFPILPERPAISDIFFSRRKIGILHHNDSSGLRPLTRPQASLLLAH